MQNWMVTIAPHANLLPDEAAGVYLLFFGSVLDYVGQSEHVRRRLLQDHHVYDEDVHQLLAMIHVSSYTDRLAMERYFNQKYNPANSYVGSGKQSSVFDARFLALTPQQRRAMWAGKDFDEFALPDKLEADFAPYAIQLPAAKLSLNLFNVPSVLSLPPEELLG
jgi:hypothetical protein